MTLERAKQIAKQWADGYVCSFREEEMEEYHKMFLSLLCKEQPTKLPEFYVIDVKTGEYPDVGNIALNEEWAKGLVYCDIDCFAIQEDGNLILTDDCGNIAYPPAGRFNVVFADGVQQEHIAPCDLCAYNPPSSFDGKPCAMCPATPLPCPPQEV